MHDLVNIKESHICWKRQRNTKKHAWINWMPNARRVDACVDYRNAALHLKNRKRFKHHVTNITKRRRINTTAMSSWLSTLSFVRLSVWCHYSKHKNRPGCLSGRDSLMEGNVRWNSHVVTSSFVIVLLNLKVGLYFFKGREQRGGN